MAQKEKNKRLVLPNPKLLKCKSADCFQLWLETPTEPSATFPKELDSDVRQIRPFRRPQAAIDERYGKWAYPGNDNAALPVTLWRVEPEKFAMQLHVADKRDEKLNIAGAGTKQAICIAFAGMSACSLR